MNVAFRKVWRDLWNNKGRTLLVVMSIGVGVLALGMITASNTLMTRQMTDAQLASHPTSLHLFLRGQVDESTVRDLAREPGIVGGLGVAMLDLHWKPSLAADWQTASLIAVDDYTRQQFDQIQLRGGTWPSAHTIAVEFNHIAPYNVPALGGTVYFEVNQRAKAVTLGGVVRDPFQFPPPFSNQPTFYVTRELMAELGGSPNYPQIKFAIADYTKPKAQAIADALEQRLKRLNVGVASVRLQDPQRHFMQDLMDGVGLILLVMASLSLGMSVFLVVNTLNAILAQQIPQIGIMKTVGGLRGQIAQLYLAGVLIYCALSLALAVPFGALGGDLLARWMLALINVPTSTFAVVQQSFWLQLLTGLLVPVVAALWPVLQGVAISVREALNAYGLGSGRYGQRWLDRWLGSFQGLPGTAALALRNTFRRPGRVALTQITLIAAGAIFMMVYSTQYSFNRTVQSIFDSFGYDVILGFDQYQRVDKIVPLIEARPNVARAEMWLFETAKGRLPGASGPGVDHQIFLRGIPTDTQLFTPELTAGRNLDPHDGHALLLNQKLARIMGLGVGDRIELELGTTAKSTWTIVGLIFDLAGSDQNTAYLHRDTLAGDLGTLGRASIVEVKTKVNTLETQAALEKDLKAYLKAAGLGVAFSDTAIKNQQQAGAQFNILTTILMLMTFLIALVGSIGLSGTLSINVLERRREIGVMRAVGASSTDVAVIFMGEGLLLGLISWLIAIPLSVVAGGYFVDIIGQTINFPAVYHYAFDGVWLWLAIVTTLSLVASWLPARRATQISVRESLAYE